MPQGGGGRKKRERSVSKSSSTTGRKRSRRMSSVGFPPESPSSPPPSLLPTGLSSLSSSAPPSPSSAAEDFRPESAQHGSMVVPHHHASSPDSKGAAAASSQPKKKVEYDDSSPDHCIPNGYEMYAIWNRDGKYHPVEILESRSIEAMAAPKTSRKPSTPSHPFQYYVHFLEFDRRMDQWTLREHMMTEKELQASQLPSDQYFHRDAITVVVDDHHGGSSAEHKAHEEATKMKNVNAIVLGKYEMETWYFSPFPVEFRRFSKLYFCEFCLKFFGFPKELERHAQRCQLRHPPGDEIYRSVEQNITISAFEVDGSKEQTYCENLCLIAKLFLDHKTLFYDTNIFLFYVICEVDDDGFHIVGFFSKEKDPDHQNNLACIMTLPCHQRKGFGRFLISLSYGLSQLEHKAGTPEKPLSDLGQVSYESYWSEAIIDVLRNHDMSKPISIEDISKKTGIIVGDLYHTLELLGLIRYEQGEHVFEISDKLIEYHTRKQKLDHSSERIHVRPCQINKLHWTPYISARRPRK